MKKIAIILLLGVLGAGCATPRPTSYLDQLRDVSIREIELTEKPVQEALHALRVEWKKQTGTDMPVAHITEQVEHDDPKNPLITFRARHIPFLTALRIIADHARIPALVSPGRLGSRRHFAVGVHALSVEA